MKTTPPGKAPLRLFLGLALASALLVTGVRLGFSNKTKTSPAPPALPFPATVTATAAPSEPAPPSAAPAESTTAASSASPAALDDTLARLRAERDTLRQRRRADPALVDISADLARIAAEEERLTAEKARALDIPLRTIDGARLSHFEGDTPIYLRSFNSNAAISTAAAEVRSTSPYNVTGSGVKIGLWEVDGLPRGTHTDLTDRVTYGDSGSSEQHATHVAGTLIGAGTVSASAKGMAPGASIEAYIVSSYADHSAEIDALAATGEGSSTKIYLSNQSYGASSGWIPDSSGKYSWYGTFSDDGDASNDYAGNYGRYATEARELDAIAIDHPYLAMFFAAGNDRSYSTPASGATWYLNGSATTATSSYAYDSSTHPKNNAQWMVDGSVTGFGTITPQSSAKNVIAIGAVNDAVSGGARSTAAASMSDFSSFGPTDDGRIKPDLVANGVSVTSLSSSTDYSTATLNGTSMATPNAAGSAALLVDYYDNKFSGQSMRASLLKALLIHTADDLGNAGPDYRYGWGLINTKTAASLIKETAADPDQSRFLDGQLSSTDASDTFTFTYDGTGEIRVTLVWTDPEASSTTTHDSRTARLVHDLNLTVTGPDGAHYPYVMPWVGNWSASKLNDAATTGVNTVDNVEQVYLSAPVSGTYTITINHAGSLTGGQVYSLALTGGDLSSGTPDPVSNITYDKVAGFGSIASVNIYDSFSTANETTYSLSVDDSSIATATLDGSGNLTITEVGVGTTYVRVTATNDLGESSTLVITVKIRSGVLYVDASHTSGTKDGSSWATAYDTLTAALSAAQSGQEIWVADGVYYASTPEASPSAGDKYKYFDLPGGVAIYGGFAGDETSLDERDPDTHLTILSGDLDQNDLNRSDNITDTAAEIVGNNTWLLVATDSDSDDFRLDGFVLTGAKTDVATGSGNWAGIFITNGANNGVIANCKFRGFDSAGSGGALYNLSTGLVLENCEFSGNRTDANGGALASSKALTLTDCVFQSNSALGHGGAVHLSGSTHLIRRCVFQGNSCEMDGGAISFTDGGNAAITNCLVTGNSAYGGTSNSNGGAFAVGSASTLTITSSTICSNNSEYSGGAFWIYGASHVYLRNCIVRENARAGDTAHTYAFYWLYDSPSSSLTWSTSLVQSSSDPLLGSVPAPSTAPTLAGDFRPSSTGPAIDSGSLSALIDQTGAISGSAGDETTDIAGDARVVDGNYNGTVYIDIGCYESDEPAVTATLPAVAIDSAGASLDLDDYFGGTGLSYAVTSSSANLLATLSDDHTLALALVNAPLGDSTFTVSVTATDTKGQTVSQSFTVTFALARLYVDASATGAGNGRSWTHAFTELRDALAYASAGDEIWIARGIYKPSATDPAVGFTLAAQLTLRGGFAGDEGDATEADPSVNVTVLSGDIDGDDTVDADGVTLSYTDQGPGGGNTTATLVTINSSVSATLTGLVVSGGAGGGLQTNSGATLALADCVVRGNQRTGDGGGLNALGSTHTFTDCQFLQNHASAHAGAIRNGAGSSTMTLDRCVLAGNSSGSNGGAYAVKGGGSGSRTIRMRDCLLTGNSAATNGGAIHSWVGGTTMYLTNCTLAANRAAGEGGSIYWIYGVGVIANNTLVWGNSGAPAIKTANFATGTWKYCLIEGSGGSAAWDATELGTDGGGNLDADPLFTSPPDAASAPTIAGDFTFDATSPAFDAGSDSLSTSGTDIAGNARIRSAAIDLGAYENISFFRPTFEFDVSDISVTEDSGAYSRPGFIESASANDDGQTLTGYTLTTDNDALFAVLPAIDLDGTLTFTPAADAYGSATVSVVLHDDGASTNVSLPLTFALTIQPATDAPTDMALDNTSVAEGTTVVGTVTATEPFGQPITWSIVNAEDGQAFTIDASTGELSFVVAPDFENPLEGHPDNIYTVVVRATGSDGAQVAQFTITVLDAPESATWSNGGGDNRWTTAANWSGALTPGALDTAYLGADSTTLLDDGSSQSIATLWVGDTGGTGDLRLSAASQLTISSALIIGDGRGDNLALSGGSTLASSGRLRAFSTLGYTATISLSGASQWTHTYGDTLDTFGAYGALAWSVTDGADVLLTHATPTKTFKFAATGATVDLTVSGVGSTFDQGAHVLQLGAGGDFTLTVSDGATFGSTASGGLVLGQNGGGDVSVEVLSGASLCAGSTVRLVDSSTLLVDDASLSLDTLLLTSGSLEMRNGATGTIASISFTNPNSVILDGATTTLAVTGSGQVLEDGGTITVRAGAAIAYENAADFKLYGSDTAGAFLVTGAGSRATFAGGLANASGASASATFTVADGASASFGGSISLTGTHALSFTGAGSSVSVAGDLTLGGGGNTLSITDGATLSVGGTLSIGVADTLTLSGGATLVADDVAGNLTNTSGTLSPADGATAAAIDGNYVQSATGTLLIEIGGASGGGGHDVLAVDGTVNLAGTVKVTLLNGFEPTLGQSFIVLACQALTDGGVVFDLPALPEDRAWQTLVTDDTITLSVIAAATDGLSAFRTLYGLAADGSEDTDDTDGDGMANLLEYALGANPLDADPSALPTASVADGQLVFVFQRPDSAETDLSYVVQSSPDLSTWTEHVVGADSGTSNGATITIEEYGDADDTVTVSIPFTGARAFARLAVTIK